MTKHFISVQHAFGDASPVPRSGLKCLSCELVIDPHTGIVVNLGTAGSEVADARLVTIKVRDRLKQSSGNNGSPIPPPPEPELTKSDPPTG